MTAMAAQSNEDLGKLIVRVTVGVLISFHALSFATGDFGMMARVSAWGLPAQLAWVAFVMEFGGALMVIFGIYARLGGLLIGIFMVSAIILAHLGLHGSQNHLFAVGQNANGTHWDHYALETQMFYLLGGFAIYLLGAGRYGLNIGGGWND
jgi:putative oxidoreductase